MDEDDDGGPRPARQVQQRSYRSSEVQTSRYSAQRVRGVAGESAAGSAASSAAASSAAASLAAASSAAEVGGSPTRSVASEMEGAEPQEPRVRNEDEEAGLEDAAAAGRMAHGRSQRAQTRSQTQVARNLFGSPEPGLAAESGAGLMDVDADLVTQGGMPLRRWDETERPLRYRAQYRPHTGVAVRTQPRTHVGSLVQSSAATSSAAAAAASAAKFLPFTATKVPPPAPVATAADLQAVARRLHVVPQTADPFRDAEATIEAARRVRERAAVALRETQQAERAAKAKDRAASASRLRSGVAASGPAAAALSAAAVAAASATATALGRKATTVPKSPKFHPLAHQRRSASSSSSSQALPDHK
jgi:hypothetical protein